MTRQSAASPGRPAASLRRDTRELLLGAAVDLFAEHGVAGTTFAMIAQRAGLTPAMLHYHFSNRELLLDAVVDERLALLIASVWGPVEAGAGAGEMICGIVERLLAGIEQMPWIPPTWMREVLTEGGLLRSRVLRHLPFDKIKILSQAVARGQAGKAINPDLDSGLIVFSLIGLVMLHTSTVRVWSELFTRKAPSRETLCRHITGVLLHGLQPARPARTTRRPKRN